MRNPFVTFGIAVCLCVSPAFGLIISEFVQDVCDQPGGPPQSGEASGQFIVVYHAGPDVIDLNGWTIGHLASTSRTTIITSTLRLNPGDRVVFGELSVPAFRAEYGDGLGNGFYSPIDLPDFQADDGIVFERDATTAACNSGVPFSNPAGAGDLVRWDSASASWVSAGPLSRTCNQASFSELAPNDIPRLGGTAAVCPPTGPCAISGIEVVRVTCFSLPRPEGHYEVQLLVSYTNAPADGILTVNGISKPVTANPQRVTVEVAPTNQLTLTAFFESGNCMLSQPLEVDISSSCTCTVARIELVSAGPCYRNGAGASVVDVTVDIYAEQPPPGQRLRVQTLSGERLVQYTGTLTRVTFSTLANDSPVEVRATFEETVSTPGCSLTTSIEVPACAEICSITGVELLGLSSCDDSGMVNVELEIRSENPNTNQLSVSFLQDPLDVVAASGTVSRVSFPALADGRPLDLLVALGPACFVETNLNVNLPDCVSRCTLSNLSVVSVTPCAEQGTLDRVEVVTMVEFEPFESSALRVGSHVRRTTSSPMLFTNAYAANGAFVNIEAGWEFSSSFNPSDCRRISIDVPLPQPNCGCAIFNTSASLAGPCRTDGQRLVDITVEYGVVQEGWELYFPGARTSFPLTGSPQTEQVLHYNLRQPIVEIREPVAIADPYPFGPAISNRVVCTQDIPINAQQCSREPCAFLDVEVLNMTCMQGGVVAVDVAITHTNVRPSFFAVEAAFNGNFTFIELRASPHVETLYLQGDGSEFSLELTLRGDFLELECFTNAINLATLPVCAAPCELTSFEQVAIGECSGGMVDVTFEIAATGATGTWFGVELAGRGFSDFFLYTKTPMQAVLRLPADGSSINVVAGQIIPTIFSFSDYNTNCAVLVQNMLSLPDCFERDGLSPQPPPPPPCEIQEVQVLGMTCQQGGAVAVEVLLRYDNLPSSIPVAADFGSQRTSFTMNSSPHVETFYLLGDGSAFSLQLTAGNRCTTNAVNLATLPVCYTPCQLTQFDPISISACSGGMVDVTFEIAASDADNTFFRIESTAQGVSELFLYTNTPMQVVLRLPGDGSSIHVLAGQVRPDSASSFGELNTGCAVLAVDMLTLPNCTDFGDAVSCSINPLTMKTVTVPPPTRSFPETILPGFYDTPNTIILAEQTPRVGFIQTTTSEVLVERCPDDPFDSITVISDSGASGLMPMVYVITDGADQVLRVTTTNVMELSEMPLGTSRIYAVVFTGELANLNGTSIDHLSPFPCGRSENFITVTRIECRTVISGVVWLDLNNNGNPDNDNLGVTGIANIPVRITDISGPVPLVLAVVTSGIGGAYASPSLEPGTYEIRVNPENVSMMETLFATTDLSSTVTLGGGEGVPDDLNFGFVPPPTVAVLESFTVTPTAGGVSLRWIIGAELDHLGYKVHRAITPDGAQQPVDDRLILADGSHGYSAFDAFGDAGDFYWLESISSNLEREFFGPFHAPGTSSEIVEDVQLVVVHHVPFTVHARTPRMLVKGLPEDATLVIPDTAKHASLEGETEPGEYILDLLFGDEVRGE